MQKNTVPSFLNMESKSKHFVFHFDKSLTEETLEDLKKSLEGKYKYVTELFGKDDLLDIHVCIYPDIKSFHMQTYGKERSVCQVGYNNKKNLISIVNPYKVETQSYQGVLRGAIYEFVLLFFKKRIPLWLSIGIASFVSNNIPRASIQFFKGMEKTSRGICIGKTSSSFFKNGGNFLSVTIIDYIIKKYSFEKLKEIVQNQEIDLFKILKIKEERFFSDWKKFVFDDKYLVPSYLNLNDKTKHFNIFYNRTLLKKTLNEIKEMLENNYQRIVQFFDVKKEFTTNVYIYPDTERYHIDAFGEKQDTWKVGSAHKNFLRIVDPDKAIHNHSNMIINTIHELVHVVTYQDLAYRPAWLSEGTAIYFSGQYDYRKKYKSEPKANCIFSNNRNDFNYNGGYFFSGSIIDYIIQKYSEDKMKEILKNPKRDPFDILGVKKESFIRSWKKFVKDNC